MVSKPATATQRHPGLNAVSKLVRLGLTLAIGLPLAATATESGLQGRQFQIENDRFSRVKPDDRWYTNGVRLSWTYKTPPAFLPTVGLKRLSEFLLAGPTSWQPTYSLGQTMYTPQDITRTDPPIGDRPWGAFGYLGFAAHRHDGAWFRVIDFKLGVTGKYALGKDVQTFIHEVVDADTPAGWHHQLRPRIGWQIGYAGIQRLTTAFNNRVALQWGAAANVGSLRRYATVGGSVMVGDLRGDVTPLFIGNEGDFVVQDFDNRDQFTKPFAYLAVAYTGVAYNYFLEGPTPYGRPGIDARHGHRTWQWGVSLPLHVWLGGERPSRHWPRLVYAQSSRTSEFRSPSRQIDEPMQRWGTLTLHWDLQ